MKVSRKVKIIFAVTLTVLLLIAGAGLTVMAADTPTPTPPVALARHDGITERTAQILGITAETLTSAEKQARQELWQKPNNATTPAPVSPDTYYDRVAQILGITRDKLVSAMQQAAREIQDEALNNQLTNAVQDGTIIQDEANQIKDWVAKRPSALDKLFGFRGFGGFGGMMGRVGRPGCGGPGFGSGPDVRGRGGFGNNPNPTQTPVN